MISETPNVLVETIQQPQITTIVQVQEKLIDDEIKISETIRRLELLRQSRKFYACLKFINDYFL